jgi:NAD(P)-dependent dehydrogenase (short-subunit alcohol dehydrogenase family)
MVAQGARRLILLGRTPIPPRADWNKIASDSQLGQKIAAIREIESLGASVHLATCDVSDEAQLKAFLETFSSENWPPIRGVLHIAGTLDDHSLLALDRDTLRNVLLPKISGGWLLHQLLQDIEIFILFSSLNSVIPQAGQSNYSAANAFLDALAHYRRQQKQAALSINWGLARVWDLWAPRLESATP